MFLLNCICKLTFWKLYLNLQPLLLLLLLLLLCNYHLKTICLQYKLALHCICLLWTLGKNMLATSFTFIFFLYIKPQ